MARRNTTDCTTRQVGFFVVDDSTKAGKFAAAPDRTRLLTCPSPSVD